MSPITLNCPICHRSGFLQAGLRRHRCPEMPRAYAVNSKGLHSDRLRQLPTQVVEAALAAAEGQITAEACDRIARARHSVEWSLTGQRNRPFPMPTPKDPQ